MSGKKNIFNAISTSKHNVETTSDLNAETTPDFKVKTTSEYAVFKTCGVAFILYNVDIHSPECPACIHNYSSRHTTLFQRCFNVDLGRDVKQLLFNVETALLISLLENEPF